MSVMPFLLVALAAGPDAGPTPLARPPELTPEVKALVEKMQSFYERTQDFTAAFRQDYAYKSFGRTATSTGTVAFKKPGQMRWDYLKPSKRSFVLSGDRIYAWDPEAQTLTRAEVKTSELSTSVTFLWGKGRLSDEFTIVRMPCAECQGILLALTPKKAESRFRELRLELDPKTAQVRKTVVVDPDGSENAIVFSDLKTNTGLGKEAFVLHVPKGAQVLDATPSHP